MYQTTMKTTQLGQTGLQITRVGFGAWALGGGNWEFGWGPQDDDESIAAIHHALAHGVNWIDTAAAYGFGRSEQIVGRALDGLAQRPYVFTKCSLLEGPDRTVTHSLTRDSILREAHDSLTRLGVDAIDLYQIHWPIPAADIEQGWAALAELKDQGLVRYIGVSNFDVEQLRRIQQIAPIETLQPAPTKSTRSSPPRASTSPTKTSPKSKGAHDEPAHATNTGPRRTSRRRPDGSRHTRRRTRLGQHSSRAGGTADDPGLRAGLRPHHRRADLRRAGVAGALQKLDEMRRHQYPAGFPVRLALKDLQLVSEVQQGSGAAMPLLDVTLERFGTASQDLADQDLAAIYELDRLIESG